MSRHANVDVLAPGQKCRSDDEPDEHGDQGVSYGRIKGQGVDTTHGAILYLEEITVSFDGFKALNNLSLDISVGELRCIIGPNGAGKTTMMDVITGKTRPSAGTAYFGQTMDLSRMTEYDIAHAGIGRKFQRPTVFEQHTVFEKSGAGDEGGQARQTDAFSRGCRRNKRARSTRY
ncbi:ATP-binding cassette domain-containing protein [Undibacterium arcticum]